MDSHTGLPLPHSSVMPAAPKQLLINSMPATAGGSPGACLRNPFAKRQWGVITTQVMR